MELFTGIVEAGLVLGLIAFIVVLLLSLVLYLAGVRPPR